MLKLEKQVHSFSCFVASGIWLRLIRMYSVRGKGGRSQVEVGDVGSMSILRDNRVKKKLDGG